ncbi:RHS repeat-associated core domain-containing protein [Pseudomonas laurentiana]
MPGTPVALLQVDDAGSVIGTHSRGVHQAYSPYGFIANNSFTTLLGFNSQPYERICSGYPLGAGQRFYAPNRQTFNQPDARSPFGKGGINSYAYCHNDPVNRHDPSGHMFEWLRRKVLDWTGLNLTAPRVRLTQTATPALPSQTTRADHSVLTVENAVSVLMREEIISEPTAVATINSAQAFRSWLPRVNVHQLTIAPLEVIIETAKHLRGSGPYASANLPFSRRSDA